MTTNKQIQAYITYLEIAATLLSIIIILTLFVKFFATTAATKTIKPKPFQVFFTTEDKPVNSEFTDTSGKYKIANSLISEGEKRLREGNKKEALKLMKMAYSAAPNYKKTKDLLEKIETSKEIKKIISGLKQQLKSGKKDKSWDNYKRYARSNEYYFFNITKPYAKLLAENACIGSATSILMTYCQLKPNDKSAAKLLKQLQR